MIDLRSDTVTAPTPAMRRAMAEAEVGDDVYGDDPTVNRLERLGAEMLGKEAAIFVPSGTFGNQMALFAWCGRGTEVLLGEECHIVQHEAGAPAVIAGVQLRTVPAPGGFFKVGDLAARCHPAPQDAGRDIHIPATSLVCVENAHSSGRAVALANLGEVKSFAEKRGIPVHMDGARIFNAAASLSASSGKTVSAADIASRADSVMFCLSKGLCAPVGSLVASTKAFVEKARYCRKIMGGGMRQAGILAAAGIIALAEHPAKLADDHGRARLLEEGLAEIPGVAVERGDINMVFCKAAAPGAAAVFRENGILINPPTDDVYRFVTHHWIGDAEIKKILEVSKKAFARGIDGKN